MPLLKSPPSSPPVGDNQGPPTPVYNWRPILTRMRQMALGPLFPLVSCVCKSRGKGPAGKQRKTTSGCREIREIASGKCAEELIPCITSSIRPTA